MVNSVKGFLKIYQNFKGIFSFVHIRMSRMYGVHSIKNRMLGI